MKAPSIPFTLIVLALVFLLVGPTNAHDLARRQTAASTTENESDTLTTTQPKTTLPATTSSSVRFSNSTFTGSSGSSVTHSAAASASASASGSEAGNGAVTSVAIATYTIPQSGGGIVTSTQFSAPSTASKVPMVQGSASGLFANMRDVGLGAVFAMAFMNLL